jgi:hypothetical protein
MSTHPGSVGLHARYSKAPAGSNVRQRAIIGHWFIATAPESGDGINARWPSHYEHSPDVCRAAPLPTPATTRTQGLSAL